ncbi:DNA cytosine methyltransferase [Ferroacidibacillus organovorans]|uniref:DNA (cytosine-5-)-methyltransferase n=1 Tax=Ferroacidibacillus organovorans TaxID=1765683 RepID=A0A124IVZ3_9BACL|nr:DNA (cytosine-5-)-methyltransferase [Ferroacidibacillus organovorans]KUO95806.1 hypothetical protein ATW55_15030 [Ferroacidibacillus organovorans]
MPLQFLDLFAGIGGMRRGLEDAGMQCVGSVERDKFARLSYQAIFQTEGEWSADDIQTVEPGSMPKADIWTFGFPCQDLSVAGKRQGFGGERSSLFFKVLDLVRARPEDHRPEWLVAENVVGFLSSNRGFDFLTAQVALAEIGYDCEWDVFNATSFGIPQHRARVFLVGHARNRGQRKVFPLLLDTTNPSGATANRAESKGRSAIEPEYPVTSCTKATSNDLILSAVASPGFLRKQQRRRFKEPHEPMYTLTAMEPHGVLVTRKGRGQGALWVHRDVATCLDASYHKGLDAHQMRTGVMVRTIARLPNDTGQTGRIFNPDGLAPTLLNHHGGAVAKILLDARIRRLTPRECWRLMGRTDAEFDCAKAAGVSDTQLYKQAGNSVIPQIVTAIGRRIAAQTPEHTSQ